jgi:hypothetical protein
MLVFKRLFTFLMRAVPLKYIVNQDSKMVTMFTVQSTDEVEDETHLEECLAEADSLTEADSFAEADSLADVEFLAKAGRRHGPMGSLLNPMSIELPY